MANVNSPQTKVMESFTKLLSDETYMDLLLKIDKTNIVKGHTFVISKRCPALLNPKGAKKTKVKKGQTIVSIPTPSALSQCLPQLLFFVYTGSLDVSKLTPGQLILLHLAGQELSLDRLVWLCRNQIRECLSMGNIYDFLKASDSLKDEFFKLECLVFAIKHYNEFISNKDGAKILGIDLYQEVVTFNASPKPAQEIGKEPANTLVEDLKAVYDEMAHPDLLVKVGESLIPCHKAVLASQSEVLAKLCASPSPHKSKDFKDVKEAISLPPLQVPGKKNTPTISTDGFISILKFLYYGERNIPATCACEVFLFSKDFQISGLPLVCEDIMKRSVTVETALNILELTYLPQMDERDLLLKRELQDNSIEFILKNIKAVDLAPLKEMDPAVAFEILCARQRQEMGEPIRRRLTLEAVPIPETLKESLKDSTKLETSKKEEAPPKADTPTPPKLQTPPKLETPPKLDTPPKLQTPPKLETPPKVLVLPKLETPPKLQTPPKSEAPPKSETPPKLETPPKPEGPKPQPPPKPSKLDASPKPPKPQPPPRDTPPKSEAPPKLDASETSPKSEAPPKLDASETSPKSEAPPKSDASENSPKSETSEVPPKSEAPPKSDASETSPKSETSEVPPKPDASEIPSKSETPPESETKTNNENPPEPPVFED